MVKEVLGGTVKSTDQDAAVRVGVKNATGDAASDGDGATGRPGQRRLHRRRRRRWRQPQATSAGHVRATASRKARPTEVAKTLGLPASAVKKGKDAANADVSVVLGKDYKASDERPPGRA